MKQVLDKTLNFTLIFVIVFLVLNEYYVIEFSNKFKDVLVFIGLILMLIISLKEILTSSSRISKFVNAVTLLCTVAGGVWSIATGQLNLLIYVCIMFSLLYCFVDLVYKKA